ncbi:hypothetical protein [Nocardia wallacei]|uniref:hypothetical protein n=1 Tax=Nocardia wallacei TaxID=480035 RepID=UPI0024571E19|nr:hypothetical protein [Nocardia wallacei]
MNVPLIAARLQPTPAPGAGRASNADGDLAVGVPEPTVWVARYAVSCLPQELEEAASFTVWVECRGPGRWFVTDGLGCYDAAGTRRCEPRRSERTEAWESVVGFADSESALAVAMHIARTMRVRGTTAADVLAERDGDS